MEILSPAGSKEAMISAVRAGADAIYFGVGLFNARRNAQNFSENELSDIVSYCHVRGVKAYLALNTLIADSELCEALNLAKSACNSSVDGIIIADLGLAKLIHKCAPDMPLHASTQMSIHNVEGVKLLKQCGYSRVVLARENSLEEIKQISEYANINEIELEIFVQGAHCMCISGQCLLSAILGSRSGNRGLCAQPCRLPFKVSNGNGNDLSLKDMNLYRYFDEFRKLGIASLKIEGRMKTPEYVAMATSCAVSALDNEDISNDLETLKSVFSRSGFTDGYLTGKIDKNMFGTRTETDIESTKQIKNSVHEIYRREKNRIGVDFQIQAVCGKPLSISVTDRKNIVSVSGDVISSARTKPSEKSQISEKVSKLGSTPYFAEKIEIVMSDDAFVPNSEISRLKLEAIKILTEKRSEITAIPFSDYEINKLQPRKKEIQKRYIAVHSLNQVCFDPIQADLVLIPFSSSVESAKRLINEGYKIGIKTPSTLFSANISKKLKEFKSIGIEYALIENLGAYLPAKEASFKLIAGTRINIFNSFSADALEFDEVMLSAELDEVKLKNISSKTKCGLYAYGKQPLMIFRNCPIRSNNGCKSCDHTITDRKNITFRICCEDGTVGLYNNRPLFLGDKAHFFNNMDFILFSFTDEDEATVFKILEMYNKKCSFEGDFTRGLYFKGVL